MLRFATTGTSSPLETFVTFEDRTHRGTYRLLARVKASSAAFQVAVRLFPDSATVIENARANIPNTTEWHLLDLGIIRVRGDQQPWDLRVLTTHVNSETIDLDYVMLIPVAEGAGQASGFAVWAGDSTTITHQAVEAYRTGYGTTHPAYEGDYLLVPPAGQAARQVRVVVKASRELIGNGAYQDSNIDDISARLHYTPRYLSIR
jgi:hypothetical protein